MVLGVATAFLLSNTLWVNYYETKRQEDATIMARDLAGSMASTVLFFGALPRDYRHIILQQLRNMGGARFFVSVNDQIIQVDAIENNELTNLIIDEYTQELRDRLGHKMGEIEVVFAEPQRLRVFNNEVKFNELPDRWVQNTLVLQGSPPLLVAQMKISENEWLYLAALLPDPYFLIREDTLNEGQWLFIALMLVVLLVITWMLVRWLTRPLYTLASAAKSLGKDIHEVSIPEEGTLEVRETARAFNAMQERIIRFIDDRERLFSAISHDLKTPITRLRLRAEMLDYDHSRERMINDLLELEELVKGALEFARGTDIHEAVEVIDVMDLLQGIEEEVELLGRQVHIEGHTDRLFEGKSLALKRCLSNVIHNAVFYGTKAWVRVEDTESELIIRIWDDGPGIPENEFDHVFEPYVRLEVSRNRNTGGTGLGLSIARNITHAHGGDLQLRNRMGAGLEVTIILPR